MEEIFVELPELGRLSEATSVLHEQSAGARRSPSTECYPSRTPQKCCTPD